MAAYEPSPSIGEERPLRIGASDAERDLYYAEIQLRAARWPIAKATADCIQEAMDHAIVTLSSMRQRLERRGRRRTK